ncbi:hypothetical protein HPO96_17690 [Kribbella sandramycini]|uniref:Trimethylamine:corrinoid methyltransferase-like protein n=1 Tax=Kribbella sandramycini TaxID=60450 RepID=A0A7Y4L0K3_9ACTN|nr:hypothetical protein [Kribbella sandramycini]MBB6565818.1 trimethylamine:corrinoid methyltransferase-like protein [Kribbella sandramycini]NOL42082.1 hypothetical protein [Kribbella sandramycini]
MPLQSGRLPGVRRVWVWVRGRDWEFAYTRTALLVVLVPGILIGAKAAGVAGAGAVWWPWALAGVGYVLASGGFAVWFWVWMAEGDRW